MTPPSDPFLYGKVWAHWLASSEVQNLSAPAFRTWISLLACAAGRGATDAFVARLIQLTGYSDRTLRIAFQELESAGLVQRKKGEGYGSNGRKSSLYTLLSPLSVAAAEAEARSIMEGAAQAISGSRGSAHTGSRRSAHTGSRGSASQDPSQDPSQIPPSPQGGDVHLLYSGRKRDWPAIAEAWEASLPERAREAADQYAESYGRLIEINPEAIYQEQLSILKRALPDEKDRILRTGRPKAVL